MSLRHLKAVFITAGLGLLGTGCAHQAAAPVTVISPPVAASAPVVASAKVTDADAQALAALLAGAVAHFEFDQDQLTSEGQAKLQNIARALTDHGTAHVRISGHADELGTEEYNLALGQRRAEVAKKYLVALGVESGRLETISYGEVRPADPTHNQKAWATNRRDELEPVQ